MARDLKVGDTVKLMKGVAVGNIPEGRSNHPNAKVKSLLTGIYKGGVVLDRDLDGMIYWHETDLEYIRSE